MPRLRLILICALGACLSCGWTHAQHVEVDDESPLNLEQVIAAAVDFHPGIRSIESRVVAAGHLVSQAELKLNPSVGLFGNEIGVDGEGQYGVAFSRTVQTGGKRSFNREVRRQQALLVEQQLFTKTQRVVTDVRIAFYRLLVAQEQLRLLEQLDESQQRAVNNARQLVEAQESPRTQLLQVQIQADQIAIRLATVRATRANAWRELAALCGYSDRVQREVTGSLDDVMERLDWQQTLDLMFSQSPEIREAEAQVAAARAVIDQQVANARPNVSSQWSVGHDTGSDDVFGGFQLSVPLQINNQNQGNIAAARAQHRAACQQLENRTTSLRKKLAVAFQEYETAWEQSSLYLNKILPRSRETLELVTQAYQEAEVSFLQLLAAQQSLTNATVSYLDSIQTVSLSRQKIEGYLLMGSEED